ncbi:DDHD domain-domain-containing protein [Kockovaella imperatae]|uniref:DDHD domain-domain-containing protein n=1 Tax=Kockovaella imperatae TaxID=4999 RepID=A0A1Y1ULH5_9TREE|nr:DDHD domain-domain-containing protein [Kockovaella imperatae]ORX38900.1 DDHD domain-domain-containing protein [Kockovaella imperatae]
MSSPGPPAKLSMPEPGSDDPALSSPPLLTMPECDYRWVHAGAQHLDLLPTPITTAATSYKAFQPQESDRIEAAWLKFSPEERTKAISDWGRNEGEGSPGKVEEKAKAVEKEAAEHKERKRRQSVASSVDEHQGIEHVYSGEEQRGAKEKEDEKSYQAVMAKAQKDYEDLELISGVPVSQDSLFEVSLSTLSLHPVFWAHSGPRVPVIRGSWFITDETKPCSWELAEEIEKAYQEIQPWQPSYRDELATAISIGQSAEDKLKRNLPSRFGAGLSIMFDDAERGRLLTTGAMTYLSRTFWSSLSKSSGTHIYRGYGPAAAASGKEKSGLSSRRGSSSSQKSGKEAMRRPHSRDGSAGSLKKGILGKATSPEAIVSAASKGIIQAREALSHDMREATGHHDHAVAAEEEAAPVVGSNDDDPPCTDLLLVIHGIGQQLATQYESYNFVYAGNQLRQCIRKQAANPALASIIRDRRCQVLPVQWRASLNLDDEKTAEDKKHDMDNRFTMADITINKSIPYVRELTNAVLLDIPLFMSHHRQKMIEAVCLQANKLFRLWIARNPDFEAKGGRVHIIGHSLGSALAAHILSNQPTKMPPLAQLPKAVITKTRDRFLFNTSNLFLCGSPLGVFLHLDQAQLMPRKGRERTMHSPQDEALDRSGKFGCMAIDSIYNVFYFTDPVAYKLNAAVDNRSAPQRPPLAITAVTAGFYATLAEGLGTISRFLPWGSSNGGGSGEKKVLRPGAIRLPSGIEMSGPSGEEKLEGSRGERRFSALNPHGNLDFYLPSAGVSEYLDMITAHASYWADGSFAAFLLAETFSTRLDLMRTGLGLARDQLLPEGTVL